MKLSPEIKAFLAAHGDRRPEELALMASRYPELPMGFIAQQAKGRQRAAEKLPSWVENEETVFPQSLALEQCSSEAVARYRAGLVEAGGLAVDLTGGFGVDARFLAERFERYLYCERDVELAGVAERNFDVFGLGDRVEVATGDGLAALRALEGKADLVFVDPARRDRRSYKVSALSDCEPDVVGVWDELLAKARRVVIKASPGLDLTQGLAELSGTRELRVIAVENECKELMFEAEGGYQGEAGIHCVNLRRDGGAEVFSFLLSEEKAAEAEYGPPGRYLYEPNAALMKAGPFKLIARRWGLRALNPRTRLYGADHVADGFQGRVFEIVGQGGLTSKEAKRLFPQRRANLISRNSGLSAVELKRKLGLRDGGEGFAVGAAVSGVGRRLFACRLI